MLSPAASPAQLLSPPLGAERPHHFSWKETHGAEMRHLFNNNNKKSNVDLQDSELFGALLCCPHNHHHPTLPGALINFNCYHLSSVPWVLHVQLNQSQTENIQKEVPGTEHM